MAEQKSIIQRIQEGEFLNKLDYPGNETWENSKEILEIKQNICSLNREIKKLEEQKKVLEREGYQKYGEETSRLTKLFRKAVEEECGTVGHPKADLLWHKAWEEGHANGYSEIYIEYLELVNLIK